MNRHLTIVALAVLTLAGASGVRAEVVMETVTIGNIGNPGNVDDGHRPSSGAVDYVYDIAKYEVTAGQYRDFLNAVAATDTNGLYLAIYDSNAMGCQITQHGTSGSYTYDFSGRPSGTEADWVDRPMNYVPWHNALRFANWMHNGQATGLQDATTTEDGVYDLSDYAPVRKSGATWVLPSEDEWYKAAFHKNDGVTGNYFFYPTSSDTRPSNAVVDPDPGNNATFWGDEGEGTTLGAPYWRTPIGEHENTTSPYGTFDQGGNVWEWNEKVYDSYRGCRGGSFYNWPEYMTTGPTTINWPPGGDYSFGFRLARIPGLTDVGTPQPQARLLDAYPNPFNPHTTIDFTVERQQSVNIAVYDISGKQVAQLTDAHYMPGTHTVDWRGLDSAGRAASSGIYLVQLRTPDTVESRKIMLVR